MSHDRLALAREAKLQLQARIAGDPRVLGIGIAMRGDGYALRVLVADQAAAAALDLPPELDGFAVDVEPVGSIRAQD